MRLPVVTKEHAIHEDARSHNEALYAAFLAGQRIDVAVTPETVQRVQLKESGDYRRFWQARGFRIRTKRNAEHTILAVWLERSTAQTRRGHRFTNTDRARGARMRRLNTLLQHDGASIAEVA